MKTSMLIALALILGTALVPATAQQVSTLRGSDAASADQAPANRAYAGGRPGGQKLVARTFRGQPPVIPHSIENVDEITAEENPCLECHITDEFKGKKMPRVPDSHLVPGKTDDIGNPVLNMARFQCNSCHAPQVDARPLVDNQFRGLAPRPAASPSSRTAAK